MYLARRLLTFGLTIAVVFFVSMSADAGVALRTRNSCRILAKYRVDVDVQQLVISINGSGQVTSTLTLLCSSSDKGCGYADATCTGNTSCGSVTVRGRVGSGGPIKTIPPKPCWTVVMGNAFVPPSSLPLSDTLGTSSNTLTAVATVDSVTGNTVLNNFTGELAATIGTRHGTVHRVVLWQGSSDTDSLLRPEKVLWDGSVRLVGGSMVTTGGFQSSDFVVSDSTVAGGGILRRVRPIPGLSKSIIVGGGASKRQISSSQADRLELAEFGSVGFGTYDPNFVFDPAAPPVVTPATSWWLVVALAGGLLALAMLTLSRQTQSGGN